MTLEFNLYFWIVLIALVGLYKLDLLSTLLNLKALAPEPPPELADSIDEETHARSQEYTRDRSVFGLVEDTLPLIALIGFWWLGGFPWLDDYVRDFGRGPVISGLIGFAILFLCLQVLSLPFEIYSTFVLEEKHGFNRTTPATFFSDHLKALFLGALIGMPVLGLIIWLFETVDHAWLWGWLAVTAFSLLITYIAPNWLMPLFHKFAPLEEGELLSAIEEMAEKCDFPLQGVYVIDGSKRSTKSNAFFTGFGKNKRIALFDTLIEKHSIDELVAVLAHEIGHFKKKHIVQRIAVSTLTTAAMFFLLGLLLKNEALFAAFGVEQTSTWLSLIFFTLLLQPLSRLLSVLGAIWSRRHEYEADAYAAQVTGHPEHLASALKELSSHNLSNLTPHPFHVFLHYSHPPLVERLRALNA